MRKSEQRPIWTVDTLEKKKSKVMTSHPAQIHFLSALSFLIPAEKK